ncbi:PA2169 family four-helix-bundle protein [Variovorax robiniae]|uniref:PA2169 family four-helix-bundle protein n=1 Tax=Variovorax robiniae TaxID=1836199 RepID=A0ABU8XLQ1_9BURK
MEIEDIPIPVDALVEVLNGLVQACHDGELGFSARASEECQWAASDAFVNRARQFAEAARELEEIVGSLGSEASRGGSSLGAVHRGLNEAESIAGIGNASSTLEECERSELAALGQYRAALQKRLPSDIERLLRRHLGLFESNVRPIGERMA